MIRCSFSRLTKIGLLLLPWFPAAVVFAVVWSHFPATDHVLVETMRSNAPSIYYSEAQQSEQAYPGIHLFARIAVVAAFAFVVGLALLLFAFIRRRRHSDATSNI